MKKSRFTESQIVAILGEAEAGMKVKEVCRKHGISDATYYNWKAKYGGMSVSELKRTNELETEEAASYMEGSFGLPIRKGCRCVGLSHGAFYRQPMDWLVRDAEVIEALNGMVEAHPRWGFWKYVKALRNRGEPWNHKRLYRVYCSLGLNQPRRMKRKLPERPREPLQVPAQQDQVWSADFMSDALYYGTRFRTFNVINDLRPHDAPGGLPPSVYANRELENSTLELST